MDGILESLFTDEKTVNARAKVVEWINELSTAQNQEKCDILVKIQEIILGSCVEVLEEFHEHILSLAHDPSMEVRKQVVVFVEQVCKVKVDFLPQVINVVSMLLRDRSPQVIKRVIQACGSIYKNGIQWISRLSEITESVESAWNVLSLIKAQILDLIDNENDGIRTNAIKFLEGIVILQSFTDEDSVKKPNDFALDDIKDNLKILKPQKLEEEAMNIFDILLKFHAATHISSVNLIACTGSLCAIAKMRPSLVMGSVVDAFKQLNANLPPTLTDSQVSSVRKSLKMQLITLLKNRGSYEYQATIRHILLDLGATPGEIQRATPKMDKQEQMRRQKRILENASNSLSKRLRLSIDDGDVGEKVKDNEANMRQQQRVEIDEAELEKQRQKSTRVNEKFIAENLRSTAVVVNLVVECLPQLPSDAPEHFLNNYVPIRDMSIQQLIATISKSLGEQMTATKIGPGAAAFTKEPPMRAVKASEIEKPSAEMQMDLDEAQSERNLKMDEEQQRKEEATKKLRENMERMKGEQELIERMKMRAKTLKLQEVTKPFARPMKEKFLLDAVKRILNSERKCIVGGVSAKRRKILTVISATFPDNVRYFILDFIMNDIKQRIDLAFSWLYEEYCLWQGFTRHSYVKSENRPDHAYNELLSQLIAGVCKNCEFREKILLLRRIYLEAPILSDDAINQLRQLCLEEDEQAVHYFVLLKDLVMLRPPCRIKLLRILLIFTVHEMPDLREFAIEQVVALYKDQNTPVQSRIDEFALEWIGHLEKETPPPSFFHSDYGRPEPETSWKDETVKICLQLFLAILPFKAEVYLEKLSRIYVTTAPDLKRTILRSLDVAIKKVGAENSILLKFIDSCPKGAEPLIIRVIYILTERVPTPNAQLLARVRELYANRVRDVRVLIPVLNGLTRQEILSALPKLVKLNQIVVKEIFNRLLGIGPDFSNQTVAVSPTDILVALHTIDVNECDLKALVKATSICLAEKEVYTQDILIGVLQQLVEVVPIPTLLMRTIIQSLTLYPRLANFVINILQRLILKQVWRQKVIWEGFLKCIQRLKPQSLPILLQLPNQQLMLSLQQCPDLREPLLEYVQSIQDEPMSGVTPQVMDIIEGKILPDVFVTDDSGGYITIDNIKKEIEDPTETSTLSTISSISTTQPNIPILTTIAPVATAQIATLNHCQPLPPGEE